MTIAFLIFGGLLSLASVTAFLIGALGLSFHSLRRRLPVRSPIDLMHWGSAGFFIGLMMVLLAQVLA